MSPKTPWAKPSTVGIQLEARVEPPQPSCILSEGCGLYWGKVQDPMDDLYGLGGLRCVWAPVLGPVVAGPPDLSLF